MTQVTHSTRTPHGRGLRIACVPDSFKGSASAAEAAAALARGAEQVFAGAEVVTLPFADGGEGTLEALLDAWGQQAEEVAVVDALGRPATGLAGRSADGRTAVLEAAQGNGLPQVSDVAAQPRRADTRGVGMLAEHLLDSDVEEILVCLGGSATTDGGTGLLRALGVQFLDADGAKVAEGGQGLADIARIETARLHPRARQVRWRLAVDVDNPLVGERGAAAVFGPQKGADADDVAALDAGLERLAEVLAETAGADAAELRERPGLGAAGGIPVSLTALLDAEVVPGSQMVAEALDLSGTLAGADVVLTGEGSLDSQSLSGKVVAAVRDHAPEGAAVVVVAGAVGLTAAECRDAGMTAALSVAPAAASLEQLQERAVELIEQTAAQACALLGHRLRG